MSDCSGCSDVERKLESLDDKKLSVMLVLSMA